MPFQPHPKRAEFDARIAAGEEFSEVGKSLNIAPDTLRAWKKRLAKTDPPPPIDPDDDAGDVRAPILGKTPAEPAKKSRRVAKTITSATAEKLIEGMFLLAAVSQSEPIWLLDDVERTALGGPLADSLAVIPSPIAAAVNAYAAPVVFFTTLIGVVRAKQNRIAARAGAGKPAAAPAPGAAAPPSTNGRPAPTPNGHVAAGAPFTTLDNDLAAAVAAAKGTLLDVDEPDQNDRYFTET